MNPRSALLYDREAVSQTYFFPHPGAPLPPPSKGGGPVALALPDGTQIAAYRHGPLDAAVTLLYLHGNGETISDQLDLWPAWARAAGAGVLFVDYPGYGASGGRPCLTSCRQAAAAALAYLAREEGRVLLVGRSVGSIFALDAAAASPQHAAGLLLESGVADLAQRLELRWPAIAAGDPTLDRDQLLAEVRRDFDHQAKLRRLGCPVTVLHCRNDSLIPSWHAERLAGWTGENLLQLELFPGGDHNTVHLVNGAAYQAALGRLVRAVGRG